MSTFSRSLFWLSLSEIVFNLAGYIIHSAMGRILGPSDYGRFGLVVTLTTMIIVLIGNGIPTAMSKYLSEVFETTPEKIYGIRRAAARLQFFLMGSVTVIFFLFAPVIAVLLNDPGLTPLFRLSALIIPAFSAASFNAFFFTGLHFFRIQAMLKMSRALARIIFIILFGYYFGVQGAISGYIAAPLVVFLIGLIAERITMKRHFLAAHSTKDESLFSMRTILQYAWPVTLFLLFYECILTLDLYFVKAMLGSDHLTGIYNAAITVGRIPYYLFYALALIMLPTVSKLNAERDEAETTRFITQALRLLALLLFPMVALLIAFAPEVLNLFYGGQYAEAVAPMRIYAVGVGFLTIFYILAFALNGAGQARVPMKLTLFGMIGIILLNLYFIPRFGITGAAMATTIISGVLMLSILVYTEIHFKVRLSLRLIAVSLLGMVGIVIAARYLPRTHLFFIASGAFLTGVHFLMLRAFGVLTPADTAPLLRLFTKKAL
ncbi:MAG: flippase [Candidatus Moraniibacteriota bacterium]